MNTGLVFPTASTEVPVIVVVVVVVVVVDTTAAVGTTVVDTMAEGAVVVYTTELDGWVLGGVLREVVVAERIGVVIGILTHVSRVWEEEEGGKKDSDELPDFAACPGRGRVVVGEPIKDEVSALGACPGRGRGVRHSVFKGEGRGETTSRPNPLPARAEGEISDEMSGLKRV